MPRDLPKWPILFPGLAYPVLWLLGFGFALLPLSGALAAMVLIQRRHAVLPPGWYLWLSFLALMLASGIQIDTAGRMAGFSLRVAMVLGATSLAVYVYSATPRSVPIATVFATLSMLWVFMVVGGWLGLLLPSVVLETPGAQVMPGSLMSNDLVDSLVRPRFSQVETPWGREPIVRPAAPFQATNGWGCNAALLMPIVIRYIRMTTGWRRWALASFTLAGVPVAMATLNRGLLVGLAIAGMYVGLRALLARDLRLLGAMLGSAIALLTLAIATGAAAAIAQRTYDGGSNTTRANLYSEAFTRTLESPWLGHGAPRPSYFFDISVGTQGHVWNVMFSHGFIALALYLAFFVVTAWLGRSATGPAFAAHVTGVVGIAIPWFYGMDGTQIAVLLLAGAVAVRDVRLRPWPAYSVARADRTDYVART